MSHTLGSCCPSIPLACLVVGQCRVCFFLQAEDGIRDTSVTGVQTCALPISCPSCFYFTIPYVRNQVVFFFFFLPHLAAFSCRASSERCSLVVFAQRMATMPCAILFFFGSAITRIILPHVRNCPDVRRTTLLSPLSKVFLSLARTLFPLTSARTDGIIDHGHTLPGTPYRRRDVRHRISRLRAARRRARRGSRERIPLPGVPRHRAAICDALPRERRRRD